MLASYSLFSSKRHFKVTSMKRKRGIVKEPDKYFIWGFFKEIGSLWDSEFD